MWRNAHNMNIPNMNIPIKKYLEVAMSLTYNEMKGQYSALRKTFDYLSSRKEQIIKFYRTKSPGSLTYIGCGSGFCLCRSGEFSAMVRLGMPSTALAAGDLMLNYGSYAKMLEKTMIIAPSRSGSTSEVIKAVKNVKASLPVPVLTITCKEGSDLSGIADFTLELPWAYDESVCQTRTVVNLYTANLLIMAYLSGDAKLEGDIDKAIKLGEGFMKNHEAKLKSIAIESWSYAVILADGEMQGIANEGAIAFTEIAKVPSHYYHLLDVRHGPMVIINKNTLVIACLTEDGFEYQKALIKDVISRGARVVTYSDRPLESIEGTVLQLTSGAELDRAACGIPFIFIPQALACFKAEVMGINPDNPDGLDAWIEL